MEAEQNPPLSTCPEIYDLALELRTPGRSLAEYFTKLDEEQQINIRNPQFRDIYYYVFLILDQVSSKIRDLDHRFRLTFSPTCGSAFEDTKVGCPDEFDFLVLVEPFCDPKTRYSSWDTGGGANLQLMVDESAYDQWVDLVESDGNRHRLSPAKLHQKFTSLIDEAMEYVYLPRGFTHGGFASPRYSGVRPHRFAHLIQLIYSPSPMELRASDFQYTAPLFITIDLTLVTKAPVDITFKILSQVQSSGLLGRFFVKCLNGSDVSDHGIPVQFSGLSLDDLNGQDITVTHTVSPMTVGNDAERNRDVGIYMMPSQQQGWVLTTAGLDHKFTNLFSSNSQLKRCIRVCKILRNKFLTLAEYKPIKRPTDSNEDCDSRYQSYIKQLLNVDRVHSRNTTGNAYTFLVQYLQSSSETIQPDVLHKLNEFTPPMCSASSGFIKYLPLRIISGRGLTEESLQDSTQVDPDLVLKVLASMSPEKEGVPHIILPKNVIWPVSMHKYHSSNSLTADYLMRSWYKRYRELMGVLRTVPKH